MTERKLQQGKHWVFFVTLWTLSGQFTGWGGETEHTWEGLVRDLYHHAKYCLAVWLPSSCNAAPLIAKATTKLKEVAFRQPVRWYEILCCYRVIRQGLLNIQWLRDFGQVDREDFVAICKLETIFLFKRHVTLRSLLKIYTYPVLPQLPERKTCLSNGGIKWNWSVSSETLDTCWFNECFAGKSVAVGNSRKETVSLCAEVCIVFSFTSNEAGMW